MLEQFNPDPLTFGEVVSIVVDVQNDFCPGGALAVNSGDEVVRPINEINRFVREHGGLVAFTRDKHPEVTTHFQEYGGSWPTHCIVDSKGFQFHPDLTIEEQDTVASKGMSGQDDGYSGFDATVEPGPSVIGDIVADAPEKDRTLGKALEHIGRVNRNLGYRTVAFVSGLAGDYCVAATAEPMLNKLKDLDVTTILVIDAIRSVNIKPDDGDKALAALEEAGALAMTSQQIIQGGVVIDRKEA